MKFREDEAEEFRALLRDLLEDPKAAEMKNFIQHGKVTTWSHCYSVARISFLLARRLHLRRINERELVRAAFLHDYFLYDWHARGDRLHGYHHPDIAANNAARDFDLTSREENIIRSHMWPLTFRHFPKSIEALLVSITDKIVSIRETLFRRNR